MTENEKEFGEVCLTFEIKVFGKTGVKDLGKLAEIQDHIRQDMIDFETQFNSSHHVRMHLWEVNRGRLKSHYTTG